jgi:hypothetical protein
MLEEFNYQNAINGLEFEEGQRAGEDKRRLIRIKILPAFGLNGSFNCERIKVVDFQPYIPPNEYW